MKKKRKTEGDTYKRKSTVGGWIAFAVVVAVLVVYLRAQPSGEAEDAMKDPDKALEYFAQMAYNLSHFQTGRGAGKATIDGLLELCLEEDKNWFQDNYERIYARSGGGDMVGADPNYMVKRNVAIKVVLDNGVNRTDYKVLEKKPRGNTVDYRVQIPGPEGTFRTVNVQVKKVKGKWKVAQLGGGRRYAL